jgi:hypothetical protein
MKRTQSIFVAIIFLMMGVVVLLYGEGPKKWFTVITLLLIGGILLRRGLLNNDSNQNSFTNIMGTLLCDKPLEASLYYFLVYFGVLSLFNDVRVYWDYDGTKGGLIYLLSFAMVVITIFDQKNNSKRKNENDA